MKKTVRIETGGRVFGNFRIVDPGNIVRCWGTQKMVLPVFEKLKAELEKECPPQKKSDQDVF